MDSSFLSLEEHQSQNTPTEELKPSVPCELIKDIQQQVDHILTKIRTSQAQGQHFDAFQEAEVEIVTLAKKVKITESTQQQIEQCIKAYINQKLTTPTSKTEEKVVFESLLHAQINIIIAIIPEPAFCSNEEGECIACNTSLLELLGSKREDTIGVPIWEIEPVLVEFCKRVTDNGGNFTEEIPIHDKIYKASAESFIMNDQPFRRVIIHDLTTEKAIGEMTASAIGNTEVAEAMVNGLSHNARTLINQIIGAVQALESSDTSEDWLQIIIEAAKKIMSLIDRFSSPEIDISPIDISTFSPEKAIQEAIDTVNLSKKKEARLEVKKERGTIRSQKKKKLPDNITSDKEKFKEILQHLIRSSLSFVKEEDINIQANTTPDEREAQITIEYKGLRLSTALQKNLFYGLCEAEETELTKFNFSIANQLTQAIGGRIEVGGEKGERDTYQLHLFIPIRFEAPIKTSPNPQESLTPPKTQSINLPETTELDTEAQLIKQIPDNLYIIIEGQRTTRMMQEFLLKQHLNKNIQYKEDKEKQTKKITLEKGELPHPAEFQNKETRKAIWQLIIKKSNS